MSESDDWECVSKACYNNQVSGSNLVTGLIIDLMIGVKGRCADDRRIGRDGRAVFAAAGGDPGQRDEHARHHRRGIPGQTLFCSLHRSPSSVVASAALRTPLASRPWQSA